MVSRGQARPTLRTVADRAGVSVSTASLVFSGKGPVAVATAERVRAAAAELGFAGPNPLASSLRQGRAGAIGVLVDADLGDPPVVGNPGAEHRDAAGREVLDRGVVAGAAEREDDGVEREPGEAWHRRLG